MQDATTPRAVLLAAESKPHPPVPHALFLSTCQVSSLPSCPNSYQPSRVMPGKPLAHQAHTLPSPRSPSPHLVYFQAPYSCMAGSSGVWWVTQVRSVRTRVHWVSQSGS